MTPKEMQDEFLKKNGATKCDGQEVIGGYYRIGKTAEQQHTNTDVANSLKGLNARRADKNKICKCSFCGEMFAPKKHSMQKNENSLLCGNCLIIKRHHLSIFQSSPNKETFVRIRDLTEDINMMEYTQSLIDKIDERNSIALDEKYLRKRELALQYINKGKVDIRKEVNFNGQEFDF